MLFFSLEKSMRCKISRRKIFHRWHQHVPVQSEGSTRFQDTWAAVARCDHRDALNFQVECVSRHIPTLPAACSRCSWSTSLEHWDPTSDFVPNGFTCCPIRKHLFLSWSANLSLAVALGVKLVYARTSAHCFLPLFCPSVFIINHYNFYFCSFRRMKQLQGLMFWTLGIFAWGACIRFHQMKSFSCELLQCKQTKLEKNNL